MPEIEPPENRGPHELPLRIITDLEQDGFIREQMAADAGVCEEYTIKEHTLMVMTQFEKYFSQGPLPLGMDTNSFRKILAVHDIGKPKAIAEGNKENQYKYNAEYAAEILQKQGLSENEIKIARALLSGDPIGSHLRSSNIDKNRKEIERMAKNTGAQPAEFFKLLKIIYMVDAGSYTEDATIEGVVKGKKSLDHLFKFDHQNQRMDFSPETKEKISALESSLLSAPELKEQIINEHLIDVQAYDGITQYTQVANVESVLNRGIIRAGSGVAKKWGGHGMRAGTNTGDGLYLTFKNAKQSFSDWKSLHWSHAGPIAVLFKPTAIDKIDLHVKHNNDWDAYVSDEGKKHLAEREGVPTFKVIGQKILKEDIEALVLSPLDHRIERSKGNGDRMLKIAPEQLEKIAINRMNRLAKNKKKEKNLVPIYNSNGDMVWPKQIPHEEVKKLIAERGDKKETSQ